MTLTPYNYGEVIIPSENHNNLEAFVKWCRTADSATHELVLELWSQGPKLANITTTVLGRLDKRGVPVPLIAAWQDLHIIMFLRDPFSTPGYLQWPAAACYLEGTPFIVPEEYRALTHHMTEIQADGILSRPSIDFAPNKLRWYLLQQEL